MISQLFPAVYADWETEAKGPRRPTAVELLEVNVVHVKDNGFKDDTGSWRNWSKFAAPGQVIMPAAGDTVRVGLDSKGFIRQLAIVGPNGAAQHPPAAAPAVQLAPATLQALAATRKPEPPAETVAEPNWLTMQPGAPQPERIVLSGGLETDDRGRAIARMNAMTTATAILSSGGGAATADEVLDLATRLEAWIFR